MLDLAAAADFDHLALTVDLTWFGNRERDKRQGSGQQKRAKFPTSKAPISAVFHSFRQIFGRAVISRNGLEAWALFPERARAEHSR
jgi:isopentenyl diphosphate isomerase/L-lactate dehydrogenase-like FMN-dependent dehydrogenase